MLVGKALSFTQELSFFFINPPCLAATLWMAIKCISEVRSYIKLQQLVERSRPPLPYFSQGSKSGNLASFKNITQLWAARVWKCSKISEFWNKSAMLRWLPYVLTKFGEVGSMHPWEISVSCDPPTKIACEKRAKSLLELSRALFNFAQILYGV